MCIPKINKNVTEQEIYNVLTNLKLGIIKKISINNQNRCVFIYFKEWFNEGNALIARERLLNGKDIKVIYDNPWFWKITALRNK